jgi:hypothetical protein
VAALDRKATHDALDLSAAASLSQSALGALHLSELMRLPVSKLSIAHGASGGASAAAAAAAPVAATFAAVKAADIDLTALPPAPGHRQTAGSDNSAAGTRADSAADGVAGTALRRAEAPNC